MFLFVTLHTILNNKLNCSLQKCKSLAIHKICSVIKSMHCFTKWYRINPNCPIYFLLDSENMRSFVFIEILSENKFLPKK